jgi:hypothetical protein
VRALRERDVGEERAPHRLLLRISPARLEDLGEAFAGSWVELADHGPHIRHRIAPPSLPGHLGLRAAAQIVREDP